MAHQLDEQALFALAGNDGRSVSAALDEAVALAQVELGFDLFPAVTAQAFAFQKRLNLLFEKIEPLGHLGGMLRIQVFLSEGRLCPDFGVAQEQKRGEAGQDNALSD